MLILAHQTILSKVNAYILAASFVTLAIALVNQNIITNLTVAQVACFLPLYIFGSVVFDLDIEEVSVLSLFRDNHLVISKIKNVILLTLAVQLGSYNSSKENSGLITYLIPEGGDIIAHSLAASIFFFAVITSDFV